MKHRRFFSSDFHLGSLLITRFAHRPWFTAEENLNRIVSAVNGACGETDLLVHVGDFLLKGFDRHTEVEDMGLKYSLDDYLGMFRPRVFLLAGNHDGNNACEPDADNMWVNLNQNWRAFVSHFPSYHDCYRGPKGQDPEKRLSVALCGHVHDKWLFMWDGANRVLNVNVGLDVWDYAPVEDVQLTRLLDFLKAYVSDRFAAGKDFKMTKAEYERFAMAKTQEVKQARLARRHERHEKKGLTPEECMRRREAAMKAKGLIK